MQIDILNQTQQGNGTDLIDFGAVNLRASLAPSDGNDLANKSYVDSISAGLDPKASCRVASTANIDLSTGGLLTIDGVTVVAGDRVLVKDQTVNTENGIYVVGSGSWSRSTDMDGTPSNEVSGGNFTFVEQGTANGGTGWVVVADGEITVGTDPILWTQFSGGGSLIAGDGIDIAANTISVDITDLVGSGIEDDGSNNFRIASSAAGNGLTGGSGTALSVQADTVGGANLASVINISANGVAVLVDDVTIGENGSNQLEVKDNGIGIDQLNTVADPGAGQDGYVLTYNHAGTNLTWTDPDDIGEDYGDSSEVLVYGSGNDIEVGVAYTLTQTLAPSSVPLVFHNGLSLEAGVEFTYTSTTLTLASIAKFKPKDGDSIVIHHRYVI